MMAPPTAWLEQQTAKVLDFKGEWQEQTQWCWAAACASISSYYAGRGRGEKYKQCEIVQHVMNISSCDCCREPGRCNVQGSMDVGMKFIRHYVERTDEAARLEVIKAEIDNQRPVGVRVQLGTGEEHIVVIVGYDHSSQLYVWNPARGYIKTDMNNWVTHVGWWQNTCFTK
jgi:Peptidase_C39 like family